jgi:DNA-binding transcriptional MerR regulator
LQQFGITEVARVTRVPVGAIRSMVRARYVAPTKGPRGALRFSFRDLVLLRTGRHLLAAGIPSRRVAQALRAVRTQLPNELPPRGLSVTAAGGRIVVHEAGARRDALSGQLLLAFEVRGNGRSIELIDAPAPDDAPSGSVQTQSATSAAAAETAGTADECERAFVAALELEETDVDAAIAAYRTCVASHSHSGARANLGRLLHLQGHISEALNLYRAGDKTDVDLLYNQAVALEDLGRTREAIATYNRVLELDANYVDAHHNVARLWQQLGDQRHAVRHWNAYRRLARAEQ